MTIKCELNDLWSFEGWSGAKDRLDDWKENYPDFVDYLSDYIEQLMDCDLDCDKIWTETELNDFVWFECDGLFDEWKAENGIDEEEDEEEKS